ncbi:MAG: hypothetical protein J6386_14490 [Candidatus Synoicihabitans palmerolidicus]|nr:hypothetical protein [Candidatus Synoicihabitans palmerolidicus]
MEAEPALAKRLDNYLGRLAVRLAASPAAGDTVALVLSGDYGRGEGGGFRDGEGSAGLYNDLEFYMLLVDGRAETAAREWCEREEVDGTAELGIDVEFKRMPMVALRQGGEPSMFYYDLLRGASVDLGRRELAGRIAGGVGRSGGDTDARGYTPVVQSRYRLVFQPVRVGQKR